MDSPGMEPCTQETTILFSLAAIGCVGLPVGICRSILPVEELFSSRRHLPWLVMFSVQGRLLLTPEERGFTIRSDVQDPA